MMKISALVGLFLGCCGSTCGSALLNDTRWCSVTARVNSGSLTVADSLRGTRVNVVYPDTKDSLCSYDASTDRWHGLLPDVMEATAQQGGFTIVAKFSPGPTEGQTYTQWAVQELGSGMDVVGDWLMDTAERRNLGVSIDYGFIDTSLVSIRAISSKEELSFWDSVSSPYEPFEYSLWLMVLGSVSATALAMWTLTHEKFQVSTSDAKQDPPVRMFEAHFLAWFQYTGGAAGFAPTRIEPLIVVASWTFLTLLLVSAYTANMATFLISEGKVETLINSIDEARVRGLPICITKGHASIPLINGLYKSPRLNLVEISPTYGVSEPSDVAAIAQAVRDGLCEGAILSMFQTQNLLATNTLCDMEMFGSTLLRGSAGFGTKSGSWTECSAVSLAFQLLQRQLSEAGVIAELYDKYITEISNVQCSSNGGSQQDDDGKRRMRIVDMAGSFCIHAILLIVSLATRAMRIWRKCYKPSTEQPSKEEQDLASSDEPVGPNETDKIMKVLERMEANAIRMEANAVRMEAELDVGCRCCSHKTTNFLGLNEQSYKQSPLTKSDSIARGEPTNQAAVDIARKVFERYDLDNSESVNTVEEAMQITTNLLYKFGTTMSKGDVSIELEALEDVAKNPMEFGAYWEWFQTTFLRSGA